MHLLMCRSFEKLFSLLLVYPLVTYYNYILLLYPFHQLRANIYIPFRLSLHEYELALSFRLNKNKVSTQK